MIWNSKQLSEALNIEIPEYLHGNNISYNSQDTKLGDIFIAFPADSFPTIKGTKDSHQFVADAIQKGASFAIVEREIPNIDPKKLLIVSNSFDSLQKMAHYKRSKSKATFIAVTGSAGKTSTKEAIAMAIGSAAKTYFTPGTFNNELGIALTIASMPDDAVYSVMEIGMNHAGEIKRLIPQINPDIAIINNILPVHLENFDSLDGIANAKLEILEGLKPNGIAIFNHDNQYYHYCLKRAGEKNIKTIYSFGSSSDASAEMISYNHIDNISYIKARINNEYVEFSTQISGEHRAMNLIVALLIADILQIDLKQAADNFKNLIPPQGRGKINKISFKGYNCVIIDDSYNASPVSTIASLKDLQNITSKNKIVILGNMMELGPDEIKFHTDLLPHILASGATKLYTTGNLMYELYKITPPEMQGKHFENYEAIEKALDNIIQDDCVILLKGSKSQKLWHIANLLSKYNQ